MELAASTLLWSVSRKVYEVTVNSFTVVNPNIEAGPRHYENIVWYPGKAAVERRKQAYFDAHPAHSDRLLPDDYNMSDEEA